MSNYSIGLSGLMANSGAIDTISNNIANASTVGYKAGEYIFQDQFYRAINPLDPARAGQGTAKQNIRRLMNMGTIQDSQNTLDMAITGSMGMFRLADGNDPDTVYYTRNGQFAVSKDVDPNFPKRSYIVNQNGMFLTGYHSQDGTNLDDQWTSRISMPPTELEPQTTTRSTVAVNLDARTNTYLPSGDVPFNPEVASSYNNKISQTVYSADDNGGAHTMTLYYRRVDDKDMTITYDGSTFYYPASEISRNILSADDANVVLTDDTARGMELVSGSNRSTDVATSAIASPFTAAGSVTVGNSSDIEPYARVMLNGLDTGRFVTSVTSGTDTVAMSSGSAVEAGDTLEFFNPATSVAMTANVGVAAATSAITLAAPNGSISPGQFLYKVNAGAYSQVLDSDGNAITVTANSGTTVTLSGQPDADGAGAGVLDGIVSGDTVLFYDPVSYRMTFQDGTKVSMSGDLFDGSVGQQFTAVTTKYEVYASLDDQFYNYTDPKFKGSMAIGDFAEPPIGYDGSGDYYPVAMMQFWGGKNIDSVVTNPVTGLPTFESSVVLTGKVTTPGNTAQSSDPDLIFTLDLTGTRNYATPFGVDQSTQDGRSVALLNSVSIDDEGKVVGTYGDGRTFLAGQVVLVNFAASDGLVPSGNNVFTASYLSGDEVHPNVTVGKPGAKGLGGIRAGAVEGSNVDLANELVKLLIQQRMYSANSQSIRAFDDTLTTTIRMAGG